MHRILNMIDSASSAAISLSQTYSKNDSDLYSKILFRNELDLIIVESDISNKYVNYLLDQWVMINLEKYALWECMQSEFEHWIENLFNQLIMLIWIF
jgi:hypothetical protein